MRLSMTRLAFGIAAIAFSAPRRKCADSRTRHDQPAGALFQLNQRRRQEGHRHKWATSRRACSTRAGSTPRRREMARRKST
jgi:hypothetical protein